MRIARALATTLAGSVIGVGGLAAPANAESCTPPTADRGVHYLYLEAHHISCHEAQAHALHTTRHGAPHGWTCTSHHVPPQRVNWSCVSDLHPHHTYRLSYRVE